MDPTFQLGTAAIYISHEISDLSVISILIYIYHIYHIKSSQRPLLSPRCEFKIQPAINHQPSAINPSTHQHHVSISTISTTTPLLYHARAISIFTSLVFCFLLSRPPSTDVILFLPPAGLDPYPSSHPPYRWKNNRIVGRRRGGAASSALSWS